MPSAPFVVPPGAPFGPWYVCHTKPRQEALAEKKLQEQGYEVYLPMLSVWKNKRHGWVKAALVMFPRYSFVRCGRAGQSIAPIRSTPGVTRLVRFGERLATLNEEMVTAIRAVAEQRKAALDAETTPFEVGRPVTIISGPLQGLAGIVSEIAANRVSVLMTLLGREQRVTLPAEQIAAA